MLKNEYKAKKFTCSNSTGKKWLSKILKSCLNVSKYLKWVFFSIQTQSKRPICQFDQLQTNNSKNGQTATLVCLMYWNDETRRNVFTRLLTGHWFNNSHPHPFHLQGNVKLINTMFQQECHLALFWTRNLWFWNHLVFKNKDFCCITLDMYKTS